MKRWFLRICALLILGAIVNVAVAWSLAAGSNTNALFGKGMGSSVQSRSLGIRRMLIEEQVDRVDSNVSGALMDCRVIHVHDAGLPLFAMRRRTVQHTSTSFSLSPVAHVVLPLPEPIWPGFAINTVFYAFVLWLLFAALFALRRRRRIKRGLCPRCAYPVGASNVCTECGTILKQDVAS